MEATIRRGVGDFAVVARFSNLTHEWWRVPAVGLPLLLWAAFAPGPWDLISLIGGLAFILLEALWLFVAGPLVAARRLLSTDPSLAEPVRIQWTANALEVTGRDISAVLRPGGVKRVRETSDLLLVIYRTACLPIPKSQLTPDQLADLKATLTGFRPPKSSSREQRS